MKIRMGFVSNSSSSSFICMVSGNIEAGYDMSMEEAGFVECVVGHEFLESYVVGDISTLKDDKDDYDVDYDEWRYTIPSSNCPICTLKHITDKDVLKYLVKTEKIDKEMLLDKIRNQCGDHKTLMETVK